MSRISREAFEQRYRALDGRVPDAAEFQEMSGLVVDIPEAAKLIAGDPFSPGYRADAMALYRAIRGAEAPPYDPARDELTPSTGVEDPWTGTTPWSFRDPRFVAGFVHAWAHLMSLLEPEGKAPLRLLEYGPGSGQFLLMAARLGVAAHGVDIDPGHLADIARQAEAMRLPVRLERAQFGEGFGEETFDRILFFEAFHHAADFFELLPRLRARLAPGGRLMIAGEPITTEPSAAIPFAWGPRLDALSVFCMRRFGWMELGFQRAFFLEALRRDGWQVEVRPFPGCSQAEAFIAIPSDRAGPAVWRPSPGTAGSMARHLLAAVELSRFRGSIPTLRRAIGLINRLRGF
jgi:SAM-dependent methyltransferase